MLGFFYNKSYKQLWVNWSFNLGSLVLQSFVGLYTRLISKVITCIFYFIPKANGNISISKVCVERRAEPIAWRVQMLGHNRFARANHDIYTFGLSFLWVLATLRVNNSLRNCFNICNLHMISRKAVVYFEQEVYSFFLSDVKSKNVVWNFLAHLALIIFL